MTAGSSAGAPSAIIATEQAYLFGTGAEALAADALNAIGQTGATAGSIAATVPGQNAQQVNLTRPGRNPRSPCPSLPDNPEGEPIGILQGPSKTCRAGSI